MRLAITQGWAYELVPVEDERFRDIDSILNKL